MPNHDKKITDSEARKLPVPAKKLPASGKGAGYNYTLHWCPVEKGLAVRVSSNGDRAWVFERQVDGKTVRRTLGKVVGAGAISREAALALKVDVSSELQQGRDRAAEKRAAKAQESLTLEAALREYVEGKRRGKDGKGLKERTQDDYLAMVAEAVLRDDGTVKRQAGLLHKLAATPLHKLTGAAIKANYDRILKENGKRRADYSAQVLRAVLNWQGVQVPGNPLDKSTAGKSRIVIAPSQGVPAPIPPERLGAWWRVATAMGEARQLGDPSLPAKSAEAADYYRFQLLTGCRGGEILGDRYTAPIRVGDIDMAGGRVILRDTKNRTDHTLLLSRQALEIAKRWAKGRRPTEALFQVQDPRKTLAAINKAAGTSVQGHGMRDTFASVAEELVTAYTLKRLLNHASAGDVTGGSYVGKSETQLRTAWQTVADAIEGCGQATGEAAA